MSDFKEATSTSKTTFAYLKEVVSLLKQKKFGEALREFASFVKAVYVNRIKGKYVSVKGVKIPMLAVVIAALVVFYAILPSGNPKGEMPLSEKADIATNTYDKNGIRVYDMRKCNYAACGVLENSSDNDYERIRIKVVFHNQTGQAVVRGTADALQVAPRTRVEFDIPCSEEFAYFKLKDVLINPAEDDADDDEE